MNAWRTIPSLGLALLLLAGLAHAQERKGLDATRGTAVVAGRPEYSAFPLTVECWAKLTSKQAYNILIANETKASATHWELFTMPQSGILRAYLPGRRPDHYESHTDIVDGRWHYVAMVVERERVRIYVDGEEKSSAASVPPSQPGQLSTLAVGALVTGELTCAGQIAQVRLTRGARAVAAVSQAPLEADADTLALWPLEEPIGGKYKDLSALHNDADLKANTSTVLVGSEVVPGGMPTAFQPLPVPEDAAPLREALRRAAEDLKLQAVAPAQLRDAILQDWSRDFAAYGRQDYPDSRPSGADPAAVRAQTYDPQALIWDRDGGPAGTVLRRTAALADRLQQLGARGLAPLLEDLRAVQAAYDRTRPDRNAPEHKALYLAACALRRQIALSNPLLDFDTLLCVAHGTFAGSVRSNPATQDYQGGHFVCQYFGHNALPGGGLFFVSNLKGRPRVVNLLRDSVVQSGRLKGRKLDYGAFNTPDLSYDGKTILFAWTENSEHKWTYSEHTCWHLFRVNADGTDLVQLTDGAVNDFDPCWLPNGRIAFVSERRGGYIRCFAAYLKVRTYTLFSMKDDGSDIRPLSYYETSEWHPTVNSDGKLVYTRWDYTDRENCLGSRLWISGPDGSDPRSPHGNYPLPYDTFLGHQPWKVTPDGRETDSRMGAPLVEMGIRQVPDSHLYMCTGAPHHGEVFGTLCMIDLRVPDDHHMSQVRRFTPDETFPETEMPGRRHYKYGTPWPLSEDFALCTVWENLALVDRFGNKELLCELPLAPCAPDERLRLIDPIPLRPRPRPPVLPQRPAATAAGAGQPATVAVMNVYDADLPFPPGTRIKWLRVTQNILKENHAMGEPMIGYERENTPRVPLGVVPVEEDGSAYFEAPVAKELIFQVLDQNYMAVQSMRSSAFVHPGEQLSCAGCHENSQHRAPKATRPAALQRAPSRLVPELATIEPISYYRQIRPIIDQRCLTCHLARKRGPQDMSYEALREGYTFWFSGAMYTDMCGAYSGVHGGSRTIPGRFGARACKIGQALLKEPHLSAVTPQERHALILWLDSNSLRLGAFYREEAQLKGELVWPTLDLDPLNLLGLPDTGRPLRHNFWHENLYGPHAFVCSDHVHDRVFIVDEQGEIRWEYAVPHPQDVWMLPGGDILVAFRTGVRRVTREKRVVWEYTTRPPNEIPNCQPLPDGNVMIGIVGECRLIEVSPKGEIVHQVQLSTPVKEPHAQFRMCRKTPEGTYLVPFTAEGAVREYDGQGKVLRSFPVGASPVAALRLENGDTLITAGGAVTRFGPGGNVVWQLTENDIPDINIAVLAGVQVLPDGDLVVCNWNTREQGQKAGAHIFEVTPDKRVVWQVTGDKLGQVAQCQLLNSDLTPRADGILR